MTGLAAALAAYDNDTGPFPHSQNDPTRDALVAAVREHLADSMPAPLVFAKPRPEFSDDELETIYAYIGYHRDVLSGSQARNADKATKPIEDKVREYFAK